MERIRLGDICEVLNGFAFKSENYVDFGIRIIRIANVQKGFIEDNTPAFYPIDSEGIDRFMLDEGDLLMSLTGNVGRVAILAKEFLPAALNQRVACLRMKSDRISKRYLFHILNSDFFEQQCIQSAKGVAQKNMSTEWLKEYEIPFYSQSKQKEITNMLDNALLIMEERKCQLRTLDTLIKARFVEMFGDPETNSRKWDCIKLGEICDLQNGYAFKSDDYLDHSSIFNCRMSNIRPGGGFDADYHPKFLPEAYWDIYQSYRLVDGDIIIAMTDMASDPKILGVPTIVKSNGHKFLLNQRVGKLMFRDVDRMNNTYVMFFLGQDYIRKSLAKSAGGSTQINVGKPAILNITILEPPRQLQDQFSAFVSQVDKSKVAVQAALDKTKLLFDSLTQQYFG